MINTATNSLITNVTVGSGNTPIGIAVTPDGSRVYVSDYGSGKVSVINTTDNTVAATVTVGTNPYGVAVTPDGSKVYVANAGSNSVSVISTATNAVTATVTVGNNPQAFGPFIMSSATRTAAPVITTPVYAGATSVSGTAAVGASVVLTYNAVRQAAVTATGGAWTVPVPALATTDTLSVTAWLSPDRMSAPVTATVVPAPTPTPTPIASGGHGSRTTYWASSGASDQGYTGPQPTPLGFSQTPAQPAVLPETPRQQQAPAETPAAAQTTSAPAAGSEPGTSPGTPVIPVVTGVAGVGVVGGGGFLVRRWWIQRQNPALFRKYN